MAIRDEELETLRRLSPKSLPDNPSQSGFSTSQIKEKFYLGLEYLYVLLTDARDRGDLTEEQLNNALESIEEVRQNIQKEIGDRNVAVRNVDNKYAGLINEINNNLLNKADIVDIIPLVDISSLGTITIGGLFDRFKYGSKNITRPFIINKNDTVEYFCVITKDTNGKYHFKFEDCVGNYTYISPEDGVDGTQYFGAVVTSTTYRQQYARTDYLEQNYYKKSYIDINKADLVNGKVPSSQLPSYVDDIKVFEKAQPFNKTFNLELEDMGLFVNTFDNNDRAIISRLSSILDLDGASHQTLTSFGYFLVDITTTFSIMGSEENQTACYVYHFVEVSGGVEFKQLTNEELQDVIATNILLCHQTNKSYRVVNREIPFGQNILGTTQSGIALTNTQYFAEIVSTLALGETSSTAFAGNRGKALETRMTSVESSVANIPNEIEEQFNDRIGATKIVNLTQSEYQALETKDSDTFYFVVED